MTLFVAALIVATFVSGLWCAGDLLLARRPAWPLPGRTVVVTLAVLSSLLGLAAALRVFLVPAHHAMYLDEPRYGEAACNLARHGLLMHCRLTWSGPLCDFYDKALGWPLLLAPLLRLFGCASATGIALNRVLGVLTVPLVALVARGAGARWWQTAAAAALLAVHPVHVEWSATGETNVSAALMLLAGVGGGLVYLSRGRSSGAALAASGLGLATAIRPENLLPALVVALFLMWAAPARRWPRRLTAGLVGAVCATAAAAGLPLWLTNASISGGAFLSSANLLPNLRRLAEMPSAVGDAVLLLAAIAGALSLRRTSQRQAAWLLLGAGISAAAAALVYDRLQPRMLLGAVVCLAPLSGMFLADTARRRPWLAVLLLAPVALPWIAALRATATPPETQVLETRIAARATELPRATFALFIAEQPAVLTGEGVRHVMSTQEALRDETALLDRIDAAVLPPVYFLFDMYCEPDFQGATAVAQCGRFLQRFTVSPVAEEALHGRRYSIGRVTGVAAGGRDPADGDQPNAWRGRR